MKLLLIFLLSLSTLAKSESVETFAGRRATGYLGWPSQEARLKAPYAPVPVVDEWLPESFSWRGSDILPEIRNQGGCGSCWSFAIIKSLEIAEVFQGNREKSDLAEQQMVSCATDAYGCGGGFMTSAKYVVNNGSTLEQNFPYKGQNLRCKSGLPVAAKATKYVLMGGPNRSPSIAEIKTAIIRFGSAFVTVAAGGSGWSGSTGKVTGCRNRSTNHMVNLVGWTENKEWVMANSWGKNWGDKGYTLIPFGCDKIGEEAGYILVD